MDKIYIFAVYTGRNSYGVIRDADPNGDTIGYAVDKDFNCISNHYSSGIGWTMHDMGITSDWQRDKYEKAFPNGYELVWIGGFKSVEDAKLAVANMAA